MNLPDGFVYVKDIDPSIIEDIRYASSNNFLGRAADGYQTGKAILTLQAALALKSANDKFKTLGFNIIVYDCYRPKRAVEDFWKWANDIQDTKMKYMYYPDYADKTKLFSDGFIAQYSKHSRGSTVDLSLVDLKNNGLVNMGSIFDFFGPVSYTINDSISEDAQKNRLMLKDTMHEFGFNHYSKEWWHYELVGEPFTRTPEDHFDFVVA